VDRVSHILFCAPSDPAADTIVQRISAHFNPTELLRLNRPSRTFAEVPGAVLPFCYIQLDKFDLPPFKQLLAYKLVVTTCRDASLLLYSRLTNADLYAAEYGLRTSIHPYAAQPSQVELHWTALLIDEAAQAMEPEALIPLSIVVPPVESAKLAFSPLFVMAGDEHQLGPRTSLPSSPLKKSLFARLFARSVYADHPLSRGKSGNAPRALSSVMLPIARPAFANLIRNYRSHPAILAVPSALFYADTLEPEATDINRLASWSEWRGRRWPVLFRDNGSGDQIEDDGGGWYNVGEAQIACWYAFLLVQTRLVQQNEICIMAPFQAQVQCLRKTIRDKGYGSLWDIDIGPTEAFQGLERGVVILCTTRSKERFINSDKRANWGIIGLPNKMNVALTRAKFGLIVIGRREILLRDPNWKALLDFCDRNGLVAGETDCNERLHDIDNIEPTRLEKVLLAKERDLNDSRVLRGVSQDDEMWTSGMQAASDMESMNEYGYSDQEENE
jgi:superfamily I DNA and/or RNA helicase